MESIFHKQQNPNYHISILVYEITILNNLNLPQTRDKCHTLNIRMSKNYNLPQHRLNKSNKKTT